MVSGDSLRGPLLVLLGSLCFSTTGFIQAISPEGATPYVLSGFRMLVGGCTLLLWCVLAGRRVSLRGWPWKSLLAAAVSLWLFQVAFFNSMLLVGVSVGTVVAIGSTPVFSGVLAWLLERKSPPAAWYPATALALAGLLLINSVDEFDFLWYELLLPVSCGACYAVELASFRRLSESRPAEESMILVLFLVGIGLLPFFPFHPVRWVLTTDGILTVLGLGVVTAALAFSLLTEGIRTTPEPVAATLALGEPMGAALLGILVLGEPCTPGSLTGISLILLSIAIVSLALSLGEKRKNRRCDAAG